MRALNRADLCSLPWQTFLRGASAAAGYKGVSCKESKQLLKKLLPENCKWYSWVEAADELGEARRTMMWALKSLLPTAPSMRMAVNKWADVMIQRWSLLRAVAALTSDGKRRGFVTHDCSAFHQAASHRRPVRMDCVDCVDCILLISCYVLNFELFLR